MSDPVITGWTAKEIIGALVSVIVSLLAWLGLDTRKKTEKKVDREEFQGVVNSIRDSVKKIETVNQVTAERADTRGKEIHRRINETRNEVTQSHSALKDDITEIKVAVARLQGRRDHEEDSG